MLSLARFALCLLALGLGFACDDDGHLPNQGNVVMLPKPGLPRYQQLGAIPVPGGVVSPAGGNFMHRRVDFTIDTLLGTRTVGAVYNTADDAWRWSWELEYGPNGAFLVDATGARAEIFDPYDETHAHRLYPGGHWLRVDGSRMRSLGGLVHAFFPNGKLAAVHWQSAAYPRLAFRTAGGGGAGPHVQVDQCRAPLDCSLVYRIERDLAGRVTGLQDRSGRRAEFSYDAEGRLAIARDPLDLANGWSGRVYEWFGPRLVAITSSEGERNEYLSAFTTGQILRVRQMGGGGAPNRVHRFLTERMIGARPLNEPSRTIHYQDPEGHIRTIRVDGHRRARSVELASGATTHYEYTGISFELSAVVRPDGTRTEWEFEGENRVVRTDASGNQVRKDVRLDGGENRADPFQRPVERIEDDLGLVEERGYDEEGRLSWIENGAAERTSFSYDGDNQLATLTTPDARTFGFSNYGEHGHAESVTFGGETLTRTYDAVGNRLSDNGLDVMDLRPGGEASRAYDADRNLVTLWVADSDPQAMPALSSIDISYRSDAKPLAIARPHGGDHAFVYDATGQLVERREKVDGAWRATLFEVDRIGRVTAEVLPNGMRRERVYNPDGELARLRSLNSGAVETDAALTWSSGRLASVSDTAHTGPETVAYDGAGRPSVIVFPDGESLEIGYDLRSRRTSELYRLPGGSAVRTLGFRFDAADRPTQLLDGAAPLVARSYRDGRPDAASYGNGLTETYSYDSLTGLLDGRTLSDGHGMLAFSTLSRTSVPASAAVEVRAGTSSPLTQTTEAHDLGLDAASGSAGKRVMRSGGEELVFDALSNLENAGPLSLAYNAERNRVVAALKGPSLPFAYTSDAAGYVTARGATPLEWSAEGRIAAIGADRFEYDALGRPTRRIVGGVERRFLFGARVETDAAGAPVRIDLASAVLELDTGTTRYRHLDYRGNVELVTDALGSVVAHYEYDAYGVVAMTGQDDGARSFAGGRLVQGLVVIGPRVHDPLAARFLAPDPVFQAVSQFTYTAGNPISWWDPSGLDASPAVRHAEGQAKAAIGIAYLLGGLVVGVALQATAGPGIAAIAGGGLAVHGAKLLADGLTEMVGANEELRQQQQQQHKQLRLTIEGGASAPHSPPGGGSPDPQGCSCGDLNTGTGGSIGFSLGGYSF